MISPTDQSNPELRFPIYKSSWIEQTILRALDKVIDYRGTPPPKSEDGIPLITAKNVRQGYISFDVKEYIRECDYDSWMTRGIPAPGDVIFTTEAPLGNVAMFPCEGKFALGQRTLTLQPNHELYSGHFIFFLLQTPDNQRLLEKSSTGSTAKGIKSSTFKKLKFSFPDLDEQQKIAAFLTSVDKKLNKLRRKHELLKTYKRGLMQKIFSQEIRFKQDDGSDFPDWEEQKLGDIFERVTRKNSENNTNVLTISAQHGLINQEKYFNKSVSAQDVTGYYLLETDNFAYNKSYSKGYPMGAIKRLKSYDKGVVSTLYICFKNKKKEETNFYEHYFDAGILNKELHKIAQEGARNHGLLNLSVVEFFRDINIMRPHPGEQDKISQILTAVNEKLSVESQRIAEIESFKKALLQKMFV